MATNEDLRLRYLTDIQAVIGRLSQNSFVIRGWSVTLVSIIFAIVGAQRGDLHAYALLAIPPAVIFWGLDAYYLRRERLFRRLYATVGQEASDGAGGRRLFEMDVDDFGADVPGYATTLFAGHVVVIPAMLVVLATALAVLAG
ncbi:hypothetical protein QLQ12_06075 [Actinoplanes sp. NEAU-A12]|uniref:Uncharacterized protein n=1 Tax=Actinoplanes sandaracinus TaxID=3045177 RepID=A0ABT6WEL1_9ACTN|nr:hypothetical protein [Actinoplanes sandaracinus]MDI6098169.1 hypothetical protein [Actinoplanes sandaracinus]